MLNLLACPNCKEAFDQALAGGYAWSIGLLLFVPLLLSLAWGIAIARG
ncbi:MAG TPA: hypothetical protein PKD64_04120 [Pirellulaceae bacterium]|nr:hypothetical protein [Pirellulaceae bacterium]HMO91358.1 hypothetical protein [Pirellulaceae bacterium]HMP70250.1 hypothetical protein [Pirellulaceae bacterium]